MQMLIETGQGEKMLIANLPEERKDKRIIQIDA